MITFRQLALRRGGRELLSDIDLTLHSGWRVGVVGRNGCGKSTLFAALKGELEPDRGELSIPKNLRSASVAQETPGLPDAAVDFVLGGDEASASALRDESEAMARGDAHAAAEAHHRIDDLNAYDARARAAKLLHGLGFKSDTHETAVSAFSGGWRARLNLGRALMTPSDLLLLDEPTNHLDLDAVVWLEEWIKRYPGTVLVISHDREFLDNVATHILHLVDGSAKLYTGNYGQFERQRAEHLRQQQIAFDKEQTERAHLQSFIDRFKAKASKARQAQSRVKRLEKMVGIEAVRTERSFRCEFREPAKLPSSLVKLNHLDAGYGEHRVLRDIKFGLEAGDRIGLLGPNGEGKSTLVKTIAGTLEKLAGERVAHKDLVIGYFAQHTVEQLHDDQTPLQHIADVAPGVSSQELRDYLGRWNFVGDRVFESIEGFSGGERARLALAMVAWKKPNLLLLDEPTNHLDLDMREALATALNDFDGALVLVAHDRNLMGLVCDTFWRVADGNVVEFDGDLDDYAAWLRSRRGGSSASIGAIGGATPAEKKSETQRQPSTAKERRAAAAQREREKPLRQRVKLAEVRMGNLQDEKAQLEARQGDPAFYTSVAAAEVTRVSQRHAEVAKLLADAEVEWLAAYEALQAFEATPVAAN
jgi:ATP-binding cassette, subfamily F, member 3